MGSRERQRRWRERAKQALVGRAAALRKLADLERELRRLAQQAAEIGQLLDGDSKAQPPNGVDL
jgi:hypothetical protein